MDMASKCRKFVPNIFNKTKCQTCFGSKEQHSAEALENNKASRKMSKCGYLFVAPGYDFNNPLDKTRRWQRRFFILYDDGELAYSVDENPDTVPQGVVDMNKCTDVKDATGSTGHQNSMAVITPEKTTYIKGNSKEEIQWWHDVLVVYPRSMCKPKQRRFTVPSYSFLNKENLQPKSQTPSDTDKEDTTDSSRVEVEKAKPKDQAFSTYRGVRSMKHTKADKHYQEGLRKSSSLHDLTTDGKDSSNLDQSRFLSRSGENLDKKDDGDLHFSDSARLLAGYSSNPYSGIPRSQSWKAPGKLQKNTLDSSSNSSVSTQASNSDMASLARRGSFDDKATSAKPRSSERSQMHRERSASMKAFPTSLTLPKIPSSVGSGSVDRLLPRAEAGSTSRQGEDGHHINENETDEHKMAKSSELQTASRPSPTPPSLSQTVGPATKYEDLMYMKKGWLIKMGTSEKDWKKHWFVLTGNSLRYYKDAKAEEGNQLDGRIDLSSCYEISELQIQRNYGFKIKTRNGEYILSAMTSGIRSNWMKAIRLCMDLQSTKNKQSKPSTSSTSTTSQRTNDDMQIESSSKSSDGSRAKEKKEFTRNVRRHYSDVNPGNISKMFSIKGITLDNSKSLSQSLSSNSSASSAPSSKEPSIERETQPDQMSPPMTNLGATASVKAGKYDPYWSANGTPIGRFVEGSDSHTNDSGASSRAESVDKDEEERRRRAKSPSAKIKERTRAKSPKLHSPPPGHEQDKFSFRPTADKEVDKVSISSEDMEFIDGADNDDVTMDNEDNIATTMPSAGEGMLVDLLENEVESLKERLEHTQHELAKSHDSNNDLKTKLQTVVREKDPTQINAMKRQLKEAKDQVSRQKVEIDQLKSKLDMSVSKLTGTEKALSEALKDVKQEKDKFLKISTEYNRKVRNLESQLKEVTGKMEKYHENSLIKDKENRKLDLDLKQSQQKMRDHEREILKLKAVEQEYRQTKARFDETEKMVSRLRMDLKERDGQIKKMEIEYEEQFENMMQEVTKERDDIEHHVEELKNELVEAKRKTDMSEEVSSNVADILREKDEIIAQLEEKVIESETKLAEVNDEANANEEENTELHSNMELLQEEIDNSLVKISSLEKSLSQYQSQIQRFEKENASLRKHMDDLRKENTELSERIEGDKTDVTHLVEDNDSLKSTVKDLEQEVHGLHERLKEVVSGHDRLSMSSDGTSHDMLHTLIMVTAEMNDINDCMLNMRRQFDKILPNFKGDQKTKLTQIAEMIEDLGQKCDNISEILKDGGSSDAKGDKIEKQTATNVEASRENAAEVEALKEKNKQIKVEADKWKAELSQMQSKFAKLQSEDNEKKEKLKMIDETYKSQINGMSKRVDDIASKNKIVVEKSEKAVKKKSKSAKGPMTLSDKIQEQLNEIEDKVEKVEKVLQTHDLSSSSADTENQTETEEESETETEDSDEYTESEEETDTDTETQEDSGALDVSQTWLSKLKEMKHQLEVTNSKVKVLTGDMDIESLSKDSDITAEVELRQTLVKCGEKIDSLTVRLSDGLKTASTEMPVFSDSTWAFQTCIKKLKDKITEVNLMVNEHDDMNAKELKNLRGRVTYLTQFVEQVDMLGENDWEIAGKIAKQELKFKHLLSHKESATRQSTFRYEDRLQLYANKLAFEAMILGQMAILVQRQQVGVTYKDALLREIHEANLQILDLERRIDSTTRELSPLEQEKDLVSSYAAILAERIVLEGQLASNTMVQDFESSENMQVLADLNVDECPTVLAMEIFLRSQLDSSVSAQLAKLSESMDNVSSHIVTKALLQGEITHALQAMKRKFKKSDASEPLPALVKRERDFAYEQLRTRHQVIIDLVNETEPLVMQTLIQLIEYTQGHSAPSLDSVCEKMTGIVQECITQYQKLHDDADSEMKAKYTHIISHLHTEMEDAISIFREEYHCYVQTASPDINPNVLKFSTDTVATDLAGMFIQKAVINGTFDHVSDLFMKSPDVSASQLMEPSQHEAEGLSDLAKNLGQILLTEAANKEKLALEVKNIDPSDTDTLVRSIGDLVGVIPDLEAYPQTFDAYAATLVREAMFQSQLTYTTYKLKLQYHRDLRDIKLKMEAGEKVVLPSEVSREAESDIQASLTTFEEILNNKYQDEIAVLNLLESEISKLSSVTGEKSCSKCKSYENCVRQLEKTFQNEISLTQERQHVHIDVLHQEVSNVILRVDKFLEDCEKEKESLISDYDERIVTLQEEFDLMRINHEEELEQSKQDIMTAVSAIKATEESTETSNLDTLKNHNRQLVKMSAMCKELLMEIRNGDGSAGQGKEIRDKIEMQLTNIESIEDDPNFTLDISLPSSPDHPSSPPLSQELPKLDRSLTAELSDENVDKLLERSQHEHEMEQLKREKEAALADEIKVTKAALDAMRKAYEEELQQEKEKYRYALKTMFTDNYVEDIRRRQEIEMEKMREELKQMSMHYESNSEDYKLLEDRLQRTKEEYKTHINQLNKSNEHLTQLVETEIQQLKEFIHTRSTGRITGNATMEEELYDAQIMVRVKDAELQKLRLQVKNLENSLERTTEEQRYTMTQYLQCIKKNQELQAKLKEEVSNKERKDSTATDEQLSKNARALRRNPSFHQRARSPSPETSPRKDSEHHSRDSHRRSRGHLSAKDLKRSKSSPSLPYVFEAKGSASNLNFGQSRPAPSTAAGVTRRDSAKYSKSPKK